MVAGGSAHCHGQTRRRQRVHGDCTENVEPEPIAPLYTAMGWSDGRLVMYEHTPSAAQDGVTDADPLDTDCVPLRTRVAAQWHDDPTLSGPQTTAQDTVMGAGAYVGRLTAMQCVAVPLDGHPLWEQRSRAGTIKRRRRAAAESNARGAVDAPVTPSSLLLLVTAYESGWMRVFYWHGEANHERETAARNKTGQPTALRLADALQLDGGVSAMTAVVDPQPDGQSAGCARALLSDRRVGGRSGRIGSRAGAPGTECPIAVDAALGALGRGPDSPHGRVTGGRLDGGGVGGQRGGRRGPTAARGIGHGGRQPADGIDCQRLAPGRPRLCGVLSAVCSAARADQRLHWRCVCLSVASAAAVGNRRRVNARPARAVEECTVRRPHPQRRASGAAAVASGHTVRGGVADGDERRRGVLSARLGAAQRGWPTAVQRLSRRSSQPDVGCSGRGWRRRFRGCRGHGRGARVLVVARGRRDTGRRGDGWRCGDVAAPGAASATLGSGARGRSVGGAAAAGARPAALLRDDCGSGSGAAASTVLAGDGERRAAWRGASANLAGCAKQTQSGHTEIAVLSRAAMPLSEVDRCPPVAMASAERRREGGGHDDDTTAAVTEPTMGDRLRQRKRQDSNGDEDETSSRATGAKRRHALLPESSHGDVESASPDETSIDHSHGAAMIPTADRGASATVPSVGSVARVIHQAVTAADAKLLESALSSVRTPTGIRRTVRHLSLSDAVPLMRALTERFRSAPARVPQVTQWIRALIAQHASLWRAQCQYAPPSNEMQDMRDTVQLLYRSVEERVQLANALARLEGRLELILQQAPRCMSTDGEAGEAPDIATLRWSLEERRASGDVVEDEEQQETDESSAEEDALSDAADENDE
eukprot:ctg_35.g107